MVSQVQLSAVRAEEPHQHGFTCRFHVHDCSGAEGHEHGAFRPDVVKASAFDDRIRGHAALWRPEIPGSATAQSGERAITPRLRLAASAVAIAIARAAEKAVPNASANPDLTSTEREWQPAHQPPSPAKAPMNWSFPSQSHLQTSLFRHHHHHDSQRQTSPAHPESHRPALQQAGSRDVACRDYLQSRRVGRTEDGASASGLRAACRLQRPWRWVWMLSRSRRQQRRF